MADTARLRGLTAYQAIYAFQQVGYAVERVGSGSFVLEHPERPPLAIPYRLTRPVAEGLMRAQIRAAGFSLDEFLAAQERG